MGLAVTILGFVVAFVRLWTIGKAVRLVRRETLHSLEKFGAELLRLEVASALRSSQELQDACQDRLWRRAIDKGTDAVAGVIRLLENQRLSTEDRELLRSAPNDFVLITKFITRNRLASSKYQASFLPDESLNAINVVVQMLLRIDSRLRNAALEFKHEQQRKSV